MPYQIVNAETGRPIVRGGTPAMFPDGALASEYLTALRETGDKRPLKIKPVDDPATDAIWQERERQRMRQGQYLDAPFGNIGPAVWWESAKGEYTFYDLESTKRHYGSYTAAIKCHNRAKHHYAHVSMTDKTKLAYTESSEKGQRDIQTQIKPGAYLTKHFSDILNHDQIAEIVRDWQRRYDSAELKFARSAADIVRIYQTGPRSCMSGRIEEYSSRKSGHHPCEVYGLPHSDITMAYIQGKNGISARCLVWEAQKKHSRIYGDGTLIARELKALGYTAAPMYGAKIAKIDAGKFGYVMAYVDDTSVVIDEGDHFKLHDENQRAPKDKVVAQCRNTNGLADGRGGLAECSDCGEDVDEDETFHVSGGYVCRSCFDDHYFQCEASGDYCNENNESQTEVRISQNSRISGGWRTQTWGERSVERYAFYCEATEAYYHQSLMMQDADGTAFSPQAVTDGIYVLRGKVYIHKDDIESEKDGEAEAAAS